ncbi:MAG: hypothetical protein GWP59_07265 [Chlamydiales bacterium]|nr:hypothetical protein [Chlamydiales bacterium]
MKKFCLLLLLLFTPLFSQDVLNPNLLKQADSSFSLGEQSVDEKDQALHFNEALDAYLGFLKENPEFSNASLFYNIANTYYHLKQFELATLYYYKAHNLEPRNHKIISNLEKAEKLLGFKESQKKSFLKSTLTFHFLSYSEKQLFFVIFLLLAFFCYSLALFLKNAYIKHLKKLAIAMLTLFFMLITLGNFFTEVEGIVLIESRLHHDKGEKYVRSDAPILKKGQKVVIIEVDQTNAWVTIQTHNQKRGFFPLSKIGVI